MKLPHACSRIPITFRFLSHCKRLIICPLHPACPSLQLFFSSTKFCQLYSAHPAAYSSSTDCVTGKSEAVGTRGCSPRRSSRRCPRLFFKMAPRRSIATAAVVLSGCAGCEAWVVSPASRGFTGQRVAMPATSSVSG